MIDHDTEVRPIARERWLGIMRCLAGNTQAYSLRRRSPRYSVDDGQITLVFNESPSQLAAPVVRAVALIDVSTDGVCVRTHKPIPVGTGLGMQVHVSGERFVLLGRVMHSTTTGDGYHIGVEIVFDDAR